MISVSCIITKGALIGLVLTEFWCHAFLQGGITAAACGAEEEEYGAMAAGLTDGYFLQAMARKRAW